MKRKTIIISDLHLSTPDAQPQKLLKFLEKHSCETLILNGDIIDRRYLKYFWKRKPEYTTTLNNIAQICKKNQTEIVYIKGNHERSSKTVTSILGEPQYETIITSNKNKYLVCHGDSFEKKMSKQNFFNIFLFMIGVFFARVDRNLGTNYKISHFLENVYGFFTNQKTRFLRNAIRYAKREKVHGIICGHIHQEKIDIINEVHYLNSWNRTETCSALAEDRQGNWKILYAK